MVTVQNSILYKTTKRSDDIEFLNRLISTPTHNVRSEEISHALKLYNSGDEEVHELANHALDAIGYK